MSLRRRFKSEQDPICGFWFVRDQDAKQYNLPEKATNIFMRFDAADKIADILNEEWFLFLKNPGAKGY